MIMMSSSLPQPALLGAREMEMAAAAYAFIPFENFFVAKRKDLVEFDLLIDDGPHNAIAARKAGKQTILIPRPWNAHIQHEFILKDSWKGMNELVDCILSDSNHQGK